MTEVNTPVAQKPAFGGCAVLGNKAKEYFAARAEKEGYNAIKGFGEFCDKLTNWGYVKLEATPDKDVFRLVGKDDFNSTKISINDTLDYLKAKLMFLKENNGIIDQA